MGRYTRPIFYAFRRLSSSKNIINTWKPILSRNGTFSTTSSIISFFNPCSFHHEYSRGFRITRRYRRSIFDAFHEPCSSKIINSWKPILSRTSIFYNTSIINSFKPSSFSHNTRFSQHVVNFRNIWVQSIPRQCMFSSPNFQNGGVLKRFYSVNRTNQPQAVKPWRSFGRLRPYVRGTLLLATGVAVTLYTLLRVLVNSECLETVAFTKRKHLVLFDLDFEREELAEKAFQEIKAEFGDKVLPPNHPQSIRVQRIAHNIIQVLKTRKVWRRSSTNSIFSDDHRHNVNYLTANDLMKSDHPKRDRYDQISNFSKSNCRWKHHDLDLKWEFIVVDMPIVNAFCALGGKIAVFSGLLDQFTSDADIAGVMGHEIGHAVARHTAEDITKFILWLPFIFFIFLMPKKLATGVVGCFQRLPSHRRLEVEADYIGMLLMASAGYDPRVAPQFYEKFGDKLTWWESLISTHPSGKERIGCLTQAKVMKEAMCLYREAQLRRAILHVERSSSTPPLSMLATHVMDGWRKKEMNRHAAGISRG